MKLIGIYQIQSKIKPYKYYIGSSVNIKFRWKHHLNSLRKNRHSNQHMQRHFNKYGEYDFVFTILHLCSKSELLQKEQEYIDTFNPVFNMLPVAGSRAGYKATTETIKRLVSAWKTRPAISMFSRLYKKQI